MKQAMQRMLPGKVLPRALYDGPLKSAIRGGLDLAFGCGGASTGSSIISTASW